MAILKGMTSIIVNHLNPLKDREGLEHIVRQSHLHVMLLYSNLYMSVDMALTVSLGRPNPTMVVFMHKNELCLHIFKEGKRILVFKCDQSETSPLGFIWKGGDNRNNRDNIVHTFQSVVSIYEFAESKQEFIPFEFKLIVPSKNHHASNGKEERRTRTPRTSRLLLWVILIVCIFAIFTRSVFEQFHLT